MHSGFRDRKSASWWIGLAWLGLVPAAEAWTNLPVNSVLQFNFQNPGARALAMGGAFIGLAEDASAVRSNPAGLVSLSKAQLGLELRQSELTSRYAAFSGDEDTGILARDFKEDVFALGYASVVLPAHPFAVSIFTHRLLDFEASIEDLGITFRNIDPLLTAPNVRIFPSQSDTSVSVTTYGAALAHQIGRFSYGVTLGYNTFKLDTVTNSYFVEFFPESLPVPPPNFDQRDDISVIHYQTGDDSGFSYSAGIRYAYPRWGVGLVYRGGVQFDYEIIQQKGPRGLPGSTSTQSETTFTVPRSYGGGLYFRPISGFDRLLDFTITVDFLRVEYSDLLQDFEPVFVSPEPSEYHIRDVNEFHVGLEWVFNLSQSSKITPIAFRLGWWSDPDHRLEYAEVPEDNTQRGLSLLFPRSDRAYHHATFGFGAVLSDRLQIDVGADVAENVSTAIISVVARR